MEMLLTQRTPWLGTTVHSSLVVGRRIVSTGAKIQRSLPGVDGRTKAFQVTLPR